MHEMPAPRISTSTCSMLRGSMVCPVRSAPRIPLSEAYAYLLWGSSGPYVLTAEDCFLTIQDNGLLAARYSAHEDWRARASNSSSRCRALGVNPMSDVSDQCSTSARVSSHHRMSSNTNSP